MKTLDVFLLWSFCFVAAYVSTPITEVNKLGHLTKITDRPDIVEDPLKIQNWAKQVVENYHFGFHDSGEFIKESSTTTSYNDHIIDFPRIVEDFTEVVEDFCEGECEWERYTADPYYYIPYRLSVSYSKQESDAIVEFLNYLSEATNFRFIEYKNDNETSRYAPYHIYIFSGGGCWSRVGRWVKKGVQVMSLASKICTTPAAMFHEFAHLFGLNHEHQRPDRNLYIKVINSNIIEEHLHEFLKIPFPETRLGRHLSTYQYNFASVLHYSSVTFSKTGGMTMVPLDKRWKSSLRYGRTMMSACDWHKILTFYPGPKKPPDCILHNRGWQYRPTPLCYELYGKINCETACHYVGGDLLKSGICVYNSLTGKPELPQNLRTNPQFPSDADKSKSGNENFWRSFLVRVNYINEIHFI